MCQKWAYTVLVPGTSGPITEKPVVKKIIRNLFTVAHNYGNTQEHSVIHRILAEFELRTFRFVRGLIMSTIIIVEVDIEQVRMIRLEHTTISSILQQNYT